MLLALSMFGSVNSPHVLAAVLVLATSAPAIASPESDGDVAAWEVGVSQEDRQEALSLFQRANELFTQSNHREAAAYYRQALAKWDHPKIHGNLSTTLIYLDDPLAAAEHLDKALAYGEAPFERHVYEQLLTNKKLVYGQLARITVESKTHDAVITLDGKPLLSGTGTSSRLVKAGRHQVVASKEGYQTYTQNITAVGGESPTIIVTLKPLVKKITYTRRWATWKPWAVVGGGVLVAAIGLPLHRSATSARDRWETAIDRDCAGGCSQSEIAAEVRDLRDRAELYNGLEITSYALGGALVVAGSVLLVLNREVAVEEIRPSGATIIPIASRNKVGMAVEVSF